MIPIPRHIWYYYTAFDAADAVGTEIDAHIVHDGWGVHVLDEDKQAAWVDEYVSRCVDKIKGGGPEIHDESYSH